MCSLATLPVTNQFQSLRRSNTALSRFADTTALLSYLTSRDGDLDEKDRIYAVLVRAVQQRAPSMKFAYTLIWCGLWPGLDRLYRRRLCHFMTDPDELTQGISLALTTLVNGLHLARVQRVAATLVRSTDRDVMDERRRRRSELVHEAPASEAAARSSSRTLGSGGDGHLAGASAAGELAALRARLAPVIGSDTDLVLAVVVLGMDQAEAARRLGLSHAAARKRFQRAAAQIRALLRLRP